jgi:RimJ/RimL family protein N-acetyltransferase
MLTDLGQVPVIDTERLRLRLPRADDLDRISVMYGDPEVMRYVGTGVTGGREEAWRGLALMLGQWVLRGYGLFAVEDREGRLVGRAGLIHPEGWPGLELGWTFLRDSWGLGYATEAAKAALGDASAGSRSSGSSASSTPTTGPRSGWPRSWASATSA